MGTPFESEIEAMIAESESEIARGNVQALYDVAMLHHDLATRRLSWHHFEIAESRLQEAANAGVAAAIETLNNWEVLRYALGRRIGRASAA